MFFSDLLKHSLVGLPLAHRYCLLLCGSWMALASIGGFICGSFGVFQYCHARCVSNFIAPLFNKFTPLEDSALKNRIEQLLTKCGFKSQGLYVMDGSTRSGHGNAYFTGFGNSKRVVFFDTLLDKLNADEIEAVLAHELGHFKHHHVIKRIAMMFIVSLVGLALLGWLMGQTWFYHGLGVTSVTNHMALILFLMVSPVFLFLLRPLMASYSRKNEFEADDYAAKHANANNLVEALVKLYRDNASTLTPDPLHSAFYDSHPPASIRISKLSAYTGR
jgi:STE24 endopeptidase